MGTNVLLGAVDVGSNAMRLLVAESSSDGGLRSLDSRRAAVRLGTSAFGSGTIDPATLDRAVEALRGFRRVLERCAASRYRAVATSAARTARNGSTLVERARREAGLELEIIDGTEEARLVRTAVLGEIGDRPCPRVIADLGGGSLEISLLAKRKLERTVVVRAGTVRLLQAAGGPGPMTERRSVALATRVRGLLRSAFPRRTEVGRRPVVACGGNAERLARLAPFGRSRDGRALDLRRLAEIAPEINSMGVRERVERYDVRRDRAEVMGLAALVLVELGRHLGFRRMDVPGVGVREGIVRDLALGHFGHDPVAPEAARSLLAEARSLGRRLRHDREHAERVRMIALDLFDGLSALHRLPLTSRLALELAAVLHDVGKAVARADHAAHGEYLVRHAEFPGLEPRLRTVLGCVLRFHNTVDPEPAHAPYASLDERGREEVRGLAAILRLADGLDHGKGRPVDRVTVRPGPVRVVFEIHARDGPSGALEGARARAPLFERVFARRTEFRNAGE